MPDLTATIAAVRSDGRQRDMRCPAHEDQRASLSVGRGDDGKVLLRCQAGCETTAVLEAAGLTWADLFERRNENTKSEIVATYDYTDEQGVLLYQVVRFYPKAFRQRRADGAWKVSGVRRVLYHLDELQGQTTAYVVEGEKDADRLRAIGLPGTTNPGGASKWCNDYAAQLKTAGIKSVVVLPDNDAPGRKHADDVAASCQASGLKVKVVELSDLPLKGDVSDWLDAGGTCDELIAQVKVTPLHDPSAAARIVALPVEIGTNGPDHYIQTHGDATKSARRSQDLPIVDLLSKLHLTAEAVRDITPDVLGERLRALAIALTGADRLRRAFVATELKKTVKLPAAIVAAALDMRDDETETQLANRITLADDEPALDPVNGAVLLDETSALIRRHVVMIEAQADACALWIGAAHSIDGLQRMPMLVFSSSAPECGKSTAATVVSAVVPRPIMVSNLTPAVLFRVIDKYRPTLIADEVDSWLNDEKSELRGVFDAAHWRAGAVIPRCVGDDHDVQLFNVFGPKVLAMIGRPPATMLSRSITITMQRKTARERAEPLREERLRNELAPLRQQWRRWTLDHLEALRAHDPTMPADLPVNRASDNWRPLVSIADLAGGSWPARARAAALALSGVRLSEDEPINVMLLADMQAAFHERGEPEYLSSEDIIVTLKALPGSQWADWNRGRGLTPAQLASRLRDFGTGPHGLRTRETRSGDKTGKRWHREDFIDAWSRYVPADPQHPQQTNVYGPPPVISNPQQSTNVAGLEMPVQPMFPGLVAGVAAPEGENEGEATAVDHPDLLWRDPEERENEAAEREREVFEL